MAVPIERGSVVWVDLDPTVGREQAGLRPAVVVATDEYLANVPGLVIVLPITTTDRDWPHHIELTGDQLRLKKKSFAMSEQPRTISRDRIRRESGIADRRSMAHIDVWLRDFLGV